ncbi:unnamed protein product [Parajaminaea phylloscopi]
MPTAVPLQPGASASSSSSRPNASSSGRLGTAPTSLRVQLPVHTSHEAGGDLLSSLLPGRSGASSSTSASHRRAQPTAPSSQPQSHLPPPPQTSDAALLASSVLAQQAKNREIQAVQESLINPPRPLLRSDLKRALTQLSTAHWLQVLQERALFGRCAYPLCCEPLAQPQRHRPSSKFRINVARGTIEPDTRNDAGGRNSFCSEVCHARAEWVRRWVLNPNPGHSEANDEEGTDVIDIAQAALRSARNEQALHGGRWEALTRRRQDQWQEIELLEDMEGNGELDGWDGFTQGTPAASGSLQGNNFQAHSEGPVAPSCLSPQGTKTSTAEPASQDRLAELQVLPAFQSLSIRERDATAPASQSLLASPPSTRPSAPKWARGSREGKSVSASMDRIRGGESGDLFDDLLGGRPSRLLPREDSGRRIVGGSTADQLGSLESNSSRNPANDLRAADRRHVHVASTGELDEDERDGADADADADEDDDDDAEQTPQERAEARALAAERDELTKMLDSAMHLREEMRDRGEWEE